MKIHNFKLIEKSGLRAKFDLELPSGLIIRDMTWFVSTKAEFVAFPSRTYEHEGKTKYFSFITFSDEPRRDNFQKQALELVKQYFKLHPPTANITIDPTPTQEELPF